MSTVGRTIELLFTWTLGVIYTFPVCLGICKNLVTRPRAYLYCKKRTERPKCLDDPVFNHAFIRLQNIRMHYVYAGEEGKPLMLFLHGFPECWFSWRHQLREFKDKYRVVAVDNRGFNETEEPTGVDAYSIDKMREDTKQLIDALGYKECILVGHDWGGALAWDFAANHPEYVSKLIVMNGPNEAMKVFLRKNLKQFLMSWYMFFFQIPLIPEWMFYRADMEFIMTRAFTPLVKKELMTADDLEGLKFAFRNSVTGPINYYRAAFRRKPPTKAGFKHRYMTPTLLLWSEKDEALSTELGRMVAAKADQCTFYIVPKANHFIQQECPQVVNKAMREWLDTGKLSSTSGVSVKSSL